MPLTAQQLYPDTFRLQDVDQTVSMDMDAMLLDLVAAQSEALHANDTVDTLTYADILRMDSIAREIAYIDSLRAVNAAMEVEELVSNYPAIEVEKSWIKDAEQDVTDAKEDAVRDRAKTKLDHLRQVQATLNL